MKSFKQWIYYFILIVLLLNTFACSPEVQPLTATVTAQPLGSLTDQVMSSPPIIPFTRTPKPINRLESVCDDGWITTKDISSISGSLVFSAEYGAFIWDISSSNSRHVFESIKYPSISVSPKQDIIATIDVSFVSPSQLWIASKDKQFSIMFPETIHNAYLNFLDNQSILLGDKFVRDKNYVVNEGTTDKFYIFSLAEDKFIPKIIFLPNWDSRGEDASTFNILYLSFISYSPNFQYVAYPIGQGNDKNVILDIENGNTVLFDWHEDSWADPYPFWRPDGKALTILKIGNKPFNHYNYFSIALDGKVTQLTHLEDVINDWYTAGYASWSPNNRYLAFVVGLRNDSAVNQTIFILDTLSGNILDLCYSEAWPALNDGFVWSPDSRYLAVYVRGKTQIIDIEKKTIHELNLDKNLRLNSFPLHGWVNWDTP